MRTVKGLFGGITGGNKCGERGHTVVDKAQKIVSSQYFISVFFFFVLIWNKLPDARSSPLLLFFSLTPHLRPVDGSKATQRREGYKQAQWKFFHTMSGTLEAPPLLDRSFKLSSIKLP